MSKKFLPIIFAVMAVAGVTLFALPNNQKPTLAVNQDKALTMQNVKNDINAGAQLLDVRTAEEYTSGHIEGAVNLSLQDIQQGTMPSVDKSKPVYVYCRSGNRSSQASAALKAAGYENIIDLGAITHVQSIGGVIKS